VHAKDGTGRLLMETTLAVLGDGCRYGQTTSLKEAMMSINAMHAKPDLRVV